MSNIHDEKKIEEIMKSTETDNFVDWQKEAMKQYAEYIRKQTIEDIRKVLPDAMGGINI